MSTRYGIRWPDGHIDAYHPDDRDDAVTRTVNLRAQGVQVELILWLNGMWKIAEYQPPLRSGGDHGGG